MMTGSKRLRRSATVGGGTPNGLIPVEGDMDFAAEQSLAATFLRDLGGMHRCQRLQTLPRLCTDLVAVVEGTLDWDA